MGNSTKLDFRLVPTKGIASGNGYRAEFVRNSLKKTNTIDIDGVIEEAQKNGAFCNMQPSIVRSNLETFFDTLITNVLTDGTTRKLDGYLELSLKIHGLFENATDDFDETQHKLELSLKPLSEFSRTPTDIQPVNVNRIKQFRVTYISAADGLHKNHQIVQGEEFVIHGSNLTLPEDKFSGVYCQVQRRDGTYLSATAPILSHTDSEIRCAWPEEYGTETIGCRAWASVDKVISLETLHLDEDRTIYASIYDD